MGTPHLAFIVELLDSDIEAADYNPLLVERSVYLLSKAIFEFC